MNDKCLKVYSVIEGPYHTSEIPDQDNDWGEAGWVVVALVEQENGSLAEEEILFDTFNEGYELVSWFKGQVAPYEVWDKV